ncbi:DUF3307 domain-containing protein [Shewanella sp. GutDb-MelDb]|uniref:DUF3307 domain-containing protein n=1 Tax=Shewanella sp. GutDb-MelDb TaxID=2058316 RepID=UPI000C7DDF72|nr:DUF3307 domain-containing protein [Shewanella sp. GutDb-MelDb]PKG58111.1 DUF3307 domain-containing protein [Shewanella sp. GutDb-MelDb]
MDNSYLLLSLLILGHVIGDFYFQPKAWVECRNAKHFRSNKLYLHGMVHGLLTLGIVWLLESDFCLALKSGIGILIIHFMIDLVKSYLPKSITYFLFDQVLHGITLYIAWLLISGSNIVTSIVNVASLIDYKVVVIVAAYITVWKPVSIFISMVLGKWSLSPASASDTNDDNSLEAAGDAIGKIERALILTFILTNQFAGIGFLLAAKSVFRFGDLTRSHDKKLTEYVMLGTLTSVSITIFIGLITGYMTGLFPVVK